jgi:glycosyltransferase involved in cell wall biosynthesis/putative flippase GtrA
MSRGQSTVSVDIVIPTYNEEHTLEHCVWSLLDYLADLPFESRITIADNASSDRTPLVADGLARTFTDVQVIHVARQGRGLALKSAWTASAADILVYMDVDLSTNLNALLPLVAPLLSGHSDLSIGTRLAPGARVLRGSKRELISRGYNLLLRGTLGAGFGDAQCGFKAIRADAARWLLPLVRDDSWFFDTELLVLAERAGLRIHQVPVDWVDDPDSRVDIWRTARDDLRGIARVGWSLARGRVPLVSKGPWPPGGTTSLLTQIMRFLGIGVLSTIGYALVFLALRSETTAVLANVAALVTTTMLNTAANRMWTFGIRGRARAVTHQAQGLLVLGVGLAVTTTALWIASEAGVRGSWPELVVLTAANLLVTIGRFAAFRLWVFRPRVREAFDTRSVRVPTPAQPCEGGSLAPTTPFAQDQA